MTMLAARALVKSLQGSGTVIQQLRYRILGPEPYRYVVERQGEIVRCPWHGWEFDITNGRSVFNPHRVRVRSYDVTVEQEEPGDEEDPSIETYPVSVEREVVVLHLVR